MWMAPQGTAMIADKRLPGDRLEWWVTAEDERLLSPGHTH